MYHCGSIDWLLRTGFRGANPRLAVDARVMDCRSDRRRRRRRRPSHSLSSSSASLSAFGVFRPFEKRRRADIPDRSLQLVFPFASIDRAAVPISSRKREEIVERVLSFPFPSIGYRVTGKYRGPWEEKKIDSQRSFFFSLPSPRKIFRVLLFF